jgi:colanic acid biosynthesis glycosyl transferase WcaI
VLYIDAMKNMGINGKRILVIGINFSPELTGIGKYTGEMVQWLVQEGYDCNVITGFPYYPDWKIKYPYKGLFYKKEVPDAGRLKIYRCPLYVPKSPTGLKRVLHDASFFLSSLFVVILFLFKKKNQYVFCIAPPFHMGFLALFYRFIKGGKIIYHIQDMQIDAARDLKVLKPDWIFTLLFAFEKVILNHVDIISTISQGMLKRISAKVDKPVLLFPNWAETEALFPMPKNEEMKKELGFDPQDKIVLYSGGIGEKQGLESLIRVAKQMEDNKNIKIVICGAGPYKDKLIHFAEENKLINIRFLPLQGKDVFNSFLNLADIHLVLQKKEAGDLVMPSKLLNILSVGGLAIVMANPGTSLFEMIRDNNMGVIIPPEDEKALKEAILNCCSQDYVLQRKNARNYAEVYLNKTAILNNMMQKVNA